MKSLEDKARELVANWREDAHRWFNAHGKTWEPEEMVPAIVAALREVREETIEEAAKVAEDHRCFSYSGGCSLPLIVKKLRALEEPCQS